MTQSVDQTSIKDVTSRRHNDPPGLWIAVVTSSVAFHLLVFWLMRYNNAFSPWFPPASQAIVPIELIEISPSSSKAKPAKAQLKAKTVSLKPAANQQSSTVTPRNENSGGINFGTSRKQRKRNTFVSKSNTQLVPKKLVPTPKPIFTPTATATPTRTDSLGNLRWKRERERISLGKPTPLPKFTPVEPRQPIGEQEQIPSRRTPRQPIGEDSPTRTTPKTPQPSTGGGLIAISRVTPEEQRSLMRSSSIDFSTDLILPEYLGSKEKQINSFFLNSNSELTQEQFLLSLVIDETGNFRQAEVIDPAIPEGERGKYQQFANSIFRGEKFQPARYPDGRPVRVWTSRFVRIKIQRR